MRARSTWTQPEGSETPRQAATKRHADIYTMNQEHPQPSATDYENGDPDSWNETPSTNKNVEAEYEGDHVKRNELGYGEFRDDTWKHKDSAQWNDGKKYDNKTAAERKAAAAQRMARALLRTEDPELVREAAVDFLAIPAPILASTLKRLDRVSPDSLPAVQKQRRAFACTKLAARLLGDAGTEPSVERLATTFMTVDDPTLKSILATVASAQADFNKRQAAEGEEEEDKGDKTAQTQKTAQVAPVAGSSEEEEEGSEATTSQEQAVAGASEEEEGGDETTSQETQEASGLTPQEMGMLDSMLQTELGGAPGVDCGGGDADLMSIFTAPAEAAPAIPMGAGAPAAAPMMASDGTVLPLPDISFEDDDGEAPGNLDMASIADLFSDNPEVQAQRQIRQQHHEQVQRVAAGYPGIGRTASATGTKKLGKVQPEKTQNVPLSKQLEGLWDGPGR